METVRNYERALHETEQSSLEEAISQMDFHQAWDLDARIKQILSVLKLEDHDQQVGTLSGGQVKRLALAVTLLNDPDFLLLDEPTNHLDVDMIEWLEEYLGKSGITLFMVTHDRYFLDRICNRIIELDELKIYNYSGNYSYYLQRREERLIAEKLRTEKARNLMRTELEWMKRMPKARTTKAKYRIDSFYALKEESEQRRNDKTVEINVQTSRLGKKILVMKDISKRFGDLTILDAFSYTFKRREKLGIIGRNGTGKTTFLNILTGLAAPDAGIIEQGETVVYGYYRQEGATFKPDRRVIDIIKEIAEVITLADGSLLSASQFLNHFLFPPEMQYVRVEKLSGGEKRRLYLMTVLMRNPNFLVLDEPTNDFDIVTLNVLEDYLASFGGCLIIVSHDRFFMDKLVDHLFIFEGNGEIYDFPGNYSDYRITQKRAGSQAGKKETRAQRPKRTKKTGTDGPAHGARRKLSFKEKKELEQLGEEIESLEAEKKSLEAEISGGSLEHEELIVKSNRLGEVMKMIDRKSDRWLELSEIDSPS